MNILLKVRQKYLNLLYEKRWADCHSHKFVNNLASYTSCRCNKTSKLCKRCPFNLERFNGTNKLLLKVSQIREKILSFNREE